MSKTYDSRNYNKDAHVAGVVRGAVVPQGGKVQGREVRRERQRDKEPRQSFEEKPYNESSEDFFNKERVEQASRLRAQIKEYNVREFTYSAKHALDLAKDEELAATMAKESRQRRSRFRMMLASSLIHNQSLGDGLASAAGLAIGFLIGGGFRNYTGRDGLTSKQRKAVRLQKFVDKIESDLRREQGVVDGSGLRKPNYFVDNVLVKAKEGAFADAKMHIPMSTESVAIARLGIMYTTLDNAMKPGADINRIRREGAEAIEALYNIAAKDGMDQGAVVNATSRMGKSLGSFNIGDITGIRPSSMEDAFNALVYHSQGLGAVREGLTKNRIEDADLETESKAAVQSNAEVLLDRLDSYAGIDIHGVDDNEILIHGKKAKSSGYVNQGSFDGLKSMHDYVNAVLSEVGNSGSVRDTDLPESLRTPFNETIAIVEDARKSKVSEDDIRLAIWTHLSDVYAETLGASIYDNSVDALENIFGTELSQYVNQHRDDDIALRQVGSMLEEVIRNGDSKIFTVSATSGKAQYRDVVDGVVYKVDPELCRIADKIRLNAELAVARDVASAEDKDRVVFADSNTFSMMLVTKTWELVNALGGSPGRPVPGYGDDEHFRRELNLLTDSEYATMSGQMGSYRNGIISLYDFNETVENWIRDYASMSGRTPDVGLPLSMMDYVDDTQIDIMKRMVSPFTVLCDNDTMLEFVETGDFSGIDIPEYRGRRAVGLTDGKFAKVDDLVPGFQRIIDHLDDEKEQGTVSLLPELGG